MVGLAKIGLIGLAVMGENLALNIERNGFPIAVYNRTEAKTKEFMEARGKDKNFIPTFSLEHFVQALEPPRKIIILVKAGKPVDAVLDQLKPLLSPGDIVIDGGNSLFTDTDLRTEAFSKLELQFIGMGVSGGEEGALWGPSLMPGGPAAAYEQIAPIVTKIAAQVADGPCVTYIGPKSAGHYVKMVHNGIEYGDMQLIAEAYDLLKNVVGMDAEELHHTFKSWNEDDDLQSFLIEITADIFTYLDPVLKTPLVELILDKAGQKGTGKWTAQNALDLGITIPTINAAIEARIISSFKEQRVAASRMLTGPRYSFSGDRAQFIQAVAQALYCSKVCSYAQGMTLLQAASTEYRYELDLAEISRIWKGGCIIRAKLLDRIQQAFSTNPLLANLLVDPYFAQQLADKQGPWREVVAVAAQAGVPCPAMSASLGYYDSYRSARLPLNLTQAQRDLFGAHTYERVDQAGTFHTEWHTT
ncbi:NADP-dependent phosphogluconate dehydrogenase [Candidatus Cyanaurora vandensis]|uniref:NADP-dependent phosphogluconate dehydrogenase n=1 Tax=Candidatus Cyanaurora vandensis TaxID=2714958 RepID=UPI00257E8BC7|nr:NADP-dependent phosphogluconate dehydrogenase [Candidatus Cyanaurora vandensis]